MGALAVPEGLQKPFWRSARRASQISCIKLVRLLRSNSDDIQYIYSTWRISIALQDYDALCPGPSLSDKAWLHFPCPTLSWHDDWEITALKPQSFASYSTLFRPSFLMCTGDAPTSS